LKYCKWRPTGQIKLVISTHYCLHCSWCHHTCLNIDCHIQYSHYYLFTQ